MAKFIKEIEVNAADAARFNKAYEKGEVISLRVEDKKQVIVTGHNILDAFSRKTIYWRADEFRKVIADWENKGYEVELVTCIPVSLPDDLKGYSVDAGSDKEWGVSIDKSVMAGEGVKARIYEETKEITEEEWETKREQKKENIREVEEKYGEVVKEWWLDVEECKIRKDWCNNKCFETLVYMRKYEWSWYSGWMIKRKEVIIQRNYGEEKVVIENAPELGFYQAQPI